MGVRFNVKPFRRIFPTKVPALYAHPPIYLKLALGSAPKIFGKCKADNKVPTDRRDNMFCRVAVEKKKSWEPFLSFGLKLSWHWLPKPLQKDFKLFVTLVWDESFKSVLRYSWSCSHVSWRVRICRISVDPLGQRVRDVTRLMEICRRAEWNILFVICCTYSTHCTAQTGWKFMKLKARNRFRSISKCSKQ